MRTFPRVYVCLARLAAATMFRRERRAIAGKLPSSGLEPSVIYFSYYRCGSRYISGIVQRLLEERSQEQVDYSAFLTHTNQDERAIYNDSANLANMFKAEGFHYGPLYWFVENLPDIERFRVLLTLRDPRDMLTSQYYSRAYAHTIFNQAGVDRRRKAREMGIDAFVRAELPELEERYTGYYENLVGRENVLFLPYEKMVTDFDDWLSDLAGYLGAPPDHPELAKIRAEASFRVKKEDKYSHRRSVQPGNHREKLKPETIRFLNERLGPLMEKFGYKVDGPADHEARGE